MNRRSFIHRTAATCISIALADRVRAAIPAHAAPLAVGIITDLHHDIMHDGQQRLQAFVDAMHRSKPHAILQMGDFAVPAEKNQSIVNLFNSVPAERLHVIGNHDTDLGHTHAECQERWGMPAPYYTQTINGYRFIVLNGNEKGSPGYKGGYPAYIGADQLEWFRAQLSQSSEPVIVVCHQPLTGYAAVDNAPAVQQVMLSFADRILLALNGHTHIDSLQYIGDIPNITVNSASYYWVGEDYNHESYAPEVHQLHPWIAKTCPYREPLFTELLLHPLKGTITLKGRKGSWVGASPAELHYTQPPLETGKEIVPFIRDYTLAEKKTIRQSK